MIAGPLASGGRRRRIGAGEAVPGRWIPKLPNAVRAGTNPLPELGDKSWWTGR